MVQIAALDLHLLQISFSLIPSLELRSLHSILLLIQLLTNYHDLYDLYVQTCILHLQILILHSLLVIQSSHHLSMQMVFLLLSMLALFLDLSYFDFKYQIVLMLRSFFLLPSKGCFLSS